MARGTRRSPPEPPDAAPLIGRDQELAHLLALLDGLAAGRGGAAAIVGEAGSGKTTLLERVAAAAVERGGPPSCAPPVRPPSATCRGRACRRCASSASTCSTASRARRAGRSGRRWPCWTGRHRSTGWRCRSGRWAPSRPWPARLRCWSWSTTSSGSTPRPSSPSTS
ncbi:DUF2791 family P-loop domain-containing protein [Aquihabitans sp. G128]|nr:DUF2791 family P-loop domain-containing protein [Aquihabitans sp. G128]